MNRDWLRVHHPIFFNCLEYHSDTWYGKQFALNNTGQEINDGQSGTSGADVEASAAWAITTGDSDIIVALLDDGVEAYGYDILSSSLEIREGCNFGSTDEEHSVDNPAPQNDDKHGQACAGIIIAQHNNYGVRGIAPGCKLMPVRLGDLDDSSMIADAINFAYEEGADVISCSWGTPNHYLVTDAIDDALDDGRDGKGAVFCFSAGNNEADHEAQPEGEDGSTIYPASLCSVKDGLLAVGASTKADSSANYSPWDEDFRLSVVAPSSKYKAIGEIWTTDRAYGGYNPDGETFLPDIGYNYPAYTGRFTGTSAACPLVAGIAALILSVDPDLYADEVVDFICSTAEEVGGYDYYHDSGSRSLELGHGRVNAYGAVVAASGFKKVASTNEPLMTDQNDVTVTLNPFNPATTLDYSIAETSRVTLTIYSVTGQKVATLVDGVMPAGRHSVVFDGSNLASGVYFYRLESPGFAKTGKMLLVK